MTVRFVLDESSWTGARGAASGEALVDAIERLLDRLDAARGRGEGVLKQADFYQTDLGDGVGLFSLLFEPDCPVRLDHDVSRRLALALDRINSFDDSGLTAYDAEFDGDVRFAPGLVWAHASCREGHHVAVIPLPLDEMPVGKVPVTVADVMLEIYFVTEESQHVDFFRSVIVLENADEAKFERLARSAFPTLDWADSVWSGLGSFHRPYIEVRHSLVRCLGSLSDYGAACFDEYGAGDPRRLARVLSARIGAEVSDENGATKRHAESRRDRTRRHRGIDKVFWWHVKLRPNVDRIHFLCEQPSGSGVARGETRIVIGLFKDHCILPN